MIQKTNKQTNKKHVILEWKKKVIQKMNSLKDSIEYQAVSYDSV